MDKESRKRTDHIQRGRSLVLKDELYIEDNARRGRTYFDNKYVATRRHASDDTLSEQECQDPNGGEDSRGE